MAAEVISIQNGGGMLTSPIRRTHGVRTKVERLRKHGNLIGFQISYQDYKTRILRA